MRDAAVARGRLLILALAIPLLVPPSLFTSAQTTSVVATPVAWAPGAEREVGPIRIVPIRDGSAGNALYMFVSPDGNSTVQVGDAGVVVVDTMSAAMAIRLVEALRTVTSKTILQVINTNADRAGGNEVLRKIGLTTTGGGRQAGAGAPIFAFEEVLNRLSSDATFPAAGWPTTTYFVETRDLNFNGEPIHVYHQPTAYTDGDSLVLFRKSDVVSAGDVYVPTRFPRFDLDRGGSLDGVLAGLNRIIELTVVEAKQEGGTMVVPAAGRLSDEADVAEYRDMVTIVRDRIQDMVNRKMTLEQVKAAKPALDYDLRYATPMYTTDMFVEAAYRSLSAARPSAR